MNKTNRIFEAGDIILRLAFTTVLVTAAWCNKNVSDETDKPIRYAVVCLIILYYYLSV